MHTEAPEEVEITLLPEKIQQLKQQKNAIILAHYYQEPAIQDIADFIGDSLELSRKAAETNADIILFAGVHFMAETAKILNPLKKVLIPDPEAGCSLADGCPASEFKAFISHYPDHTIITYINCSAEVKAMSDIICTSGNALNIINSLPHNAKIVFAPDKNLGRYLIEKSGRDMVLWDGVCEVHQEMNMDRLIKMKEKYPAAKLIAHPECTSEVLALADFVGSTSKLLKYTVEDKAEQFIVITENGILHKMKQLSPAKMFYEAPTSQVNSCACSECRYMKKNTLQKVYEALKNEKPEIIVDPFIAQKAIKAINKMLLYN